jgi:hypothetical protein
MSPRRFVRRVLAVDRLDRLISIYPSLPTAVAARTPRGGPVALTGAGVMADIARHLQTAYRDADVGLLASLLHPHVQWTGLCRNREQVLDWYRGLLVGGTVATIPAWKSTARPSCSALNRPGCGRAGQRLQPTAA